jgi:hypothetical protein
MADGFQDLTDAHRAVSGLLEQFRETHDDATAREACTALAHHSQVEEIAVYPLVRDRVPDGGALAERAELEHGGVEAEVAHVMAAPPIDLADTMAHITEMVEAHVAFEEQELLPKLRTVVDAQELARGLAEAEEAVRTRAGEPLF